MDAKDEIIAQLQNDNAILKELVKQLQDRIAVLEKNSSNSSKPPSSDIVKPPKHLTGTPGKKKRKRGAQPGHKRNLRKPFEENQVDKFVELDLKSCPTCGGKLVPLSEPPKVHRQVELVDKPFIVTEYRQGWYWCEHCQCHHAAELPKDVAQAGLFGPKLISLTAYLKGRGHMSYKTLQDFFADALSLKVSTGFLAKQVRKVTDAMKKPYEELLERLPNETHLAWGTIPNDKDAINLAQRLWNWKAEYFRFIGEKIPPTNNLGEQAIRKVVIDRKMTQGTRSDWGNRWLERFWSVLSTCEQQGTNVMSFLKSSVDSFLHGLAPPSLLDG